MSRGTVVNPWQVKEFVVDKTYTSRMLIDETNSESKNIQINEGRVAVGEATGGGIHNGFDEVYIVMSGEGVVHLDGVDHPVKGGSVIFIPQGTFHSITNTSENEEFVINAIWPIKPDKGINEVYDMRKEAWGGKTFKLIDED